MNCLNCGGTGATGKRMCFSCSGTGISSCKICDNSLVVGRIVCGHGRVVLGGASMREDKYYLLDIDSLVENKINPHIYGPFSSREAAAGKIDFLATDSRERTFLILKNLEYYEVLAAKVPTPRTIVQTVHSRHL